MIVMKKGFTLIELLVSITIIAVLISVGVVTFGSATRRSRDARRKSDVEQLRSALEMYRADNNAYPSSAGAWQTINSSSILQTSLVTGAIVYLPVLPQDPRNSTQQYRYQGAAAAYCITTYLETNNTSDVDSCTPDSAGGPSGYTTYPYGLRSP